jgi:hypothetical protein
MPEIQVDFIAILVAVVASFFFGFLWYTPLFGKAWAKEMGMDTGAKPTGGQMAKGMIIMLIGNFFLAYVLSHNLAVWNPETWGLAPMENSEMMFISSSAFFTWLGFFLPTDLGAIAWEGKTWKLFAINTVYHLLNLILVAAILVYM